MTRTERADPAHGLRHSLALCSSALQPWGLSQVQSMPVIPGAALQSPLRGPLGKPALLRAQSWGLYKVPWRGACVCSMGGTHPQASWVSRLPSLSAAVYRGLVLPILLCSCSLHCCVLPHLPIFSLSPSYPDFAQPSVLFFGQDGQFSPQNFQKSPGLLNQAPNLLPI